MTEKAKRYMDFMGPSTRTKKSSGADPLATKPVARSVVKSVPTKTSLKPDSRPKTTYVSNPSTAAGPKTTAKKALKTTSPKKDSDGLAIKAAAALSGTSLKSAAEEPDGNKYSLTGKSPFLASYNIEKRPLSSSVKAPKVEEISKKNVYKRDDKKTETAKNTKKGPVTIIDQPKKSGGFSLFLIIILTIILGAAVGAGAYFLLPK